MKKTSEAQLEAKLRAIDIENMIDDMMPLEDMKKSAVYEYEKRKRTKKNRHTSSISHQLAAIAAVAICLMGGSFLFSVFTPTVIGNANDFMKHVGIWVNNVLQLGIVVETPLECPDNGLNVAKTQASFISVEEASSFFNIPLLKLKDDSEDYTLDVIIAELDIIPFYTLSYQYKDEAGDLVSFEYEYIADEVNVNIDDNTSEWISPIGAMLLWNSGNNTNALYSYDTYILHMKTTLNETNFKTFIGNCVLLNSP